MYDEDKDGGAVRHYMASDAGDRYFGFGEASGEICGGEPMKAREPLQPRARAAATGSDRYWVLGLSAAWFHGCRSTEKNL